tara:strand:+ start:1534 stop:2088 length:555 start_codon:yes stop_codon:yes gene_type:complete
MSKEKTLEAIQEINQLYSDAGYSDVGQFMKNVAATESNLGMDKMGGYSFGASQIDPIKYKDIVQRATGPEGAKRVQIANQYLQDKLNRPDFDILNLDLSQENHNPYISAALTRMGLLNIPSAIPEDLEGQANYWKQNWNTKAGKGTEEHFIKQSQFYLDETPDESFMDDIVNPGYQSAFLDTMV